MIKSNSDYTVFVRSKTDLQCLLDTSFDFTIFFCSTDQANNEVERSILF